MEQQHDYAGIIIESFSNVIESFSSIKMVSSDIQVPKKRGAACDILIHIGIFGEIEAKIFMSMNAPTGMALASEMMGGMEMPEIDELVVSAVAEFCNIVIGNTCSSLSEQEMSVDITPPIVISESGQGALAEDASYNIVIHLCDLGDIDFGVAMKKAL